MLNLVSTSAFHGSLLRVNHSTCYPNTREQVLGTIFKWISLAAPRASQLLWLNGAAGAGKTSICHSVVDLCTKNNIPVATFFFSHADPARNSIKTVVATIAYQVVQLAPSAKDFITHAIDSNPLIFHQSFESQLEKLIIEPLQKLYGTISEVPWKLLLIFDGLDECSKTKEDQILLICALAEYLAIQNVPLMVIISSRKECHLTMAFNSLNSTSLLSKISLDNEYSANNDIHHFLNERFEEIKKTHPSKHLIPCSWPTPHAIDYITHKSSGQFVYASIVLKFVSSPYSYPPDQLHALLDNGSIVSTAFAELDQLYQNIFKEINNLALVKSILACVLKSNTSLQDISYRLSISSTVIYTALAGLSSIVNCQNDKISFLHNSLPDFLVEKSRSGVYYIKIDPKLTRNLSFEAWMEHTQRSQSNYWKGRKKQDRQSM